MDKKNNESTREALKCAARKLLLNCTDWTEVTARAITKEAGVNLAMINYCFGSKEALLYEVFRDLQEEVLKCKPELSEILNSDMSPKEKLIEGYFHLMKLMLDYFSMSQSVVKFCVMNKKIDLDDRNFRDPNGMMGGSVNISFKDGDSYIHTSLQEQGYAVMAAQGELMNLFNNA